MWDVAIITVGVIRVDVRIGGVPALDGTVDASTETLLPRAAHYHAQHCPPVDRERVTTMMVRLLIAEGFSKQCCFRKLKARTENVCQFTNKKKTSQTKTR